MDMYLHSFSHFPNEYDIEGVQIMVVGRVQQWLWLTNTDTTKENDQIQQKEFKYHKPRVDSENHAR